MAKYFTSIFHEEVIPVNELKEEIKAQHANRRAAEKSSGSKGHVKNGKVQTSYDRYKDEENAYKDNNLPAIRNKKDLANRKSRAEVSARNAERKAKNESFLFDIELV